jgi:hypothetical protein
MTDKPQDIILNQTVALLSRYGFENRGYTMAELLETWLEYYPVNWIRLAVIEALYQGRYKMISIEQKMNLWLRRGQATYHFTHEFEHLICRNLSYNLTIARENLGRATGKQQYSPSSVSLPAPAVAQRHKSNTITFQIATDNSNGSEGVNPSEDDVGEQKSRLTDLKELFAKLENRKEDADNLTSISQLVAMPKSNPEGETHASSVINEFIPLLDHSELYTKLKAVVRQELNSR